MTSHPRCSPQCRAHPPLHFSAAALTVPPGRERPHTRRRPCRSAPKPARGRIVQVAPVRRLHVLGMRLVHEYQSGTTGKPASGGPAPAISHDQGRGAKVHRRRAAPACATTPSITRKVCLINCAQSWPCPGDSGAPSRGTWALCFAVCSRQRGPASNYQLYNVLRMPSHTAKPRTPLGCRLERSCNFESPSGGGATFCRRR